MRLISLVEIQLATGTLYLATEDGLIDDSGNIYSEKVVGHPVLEQRLSHAYFGTADRGALSVSLANLDETLTTVFSSPNEPRDKLMIVRRMRLDVTPIDYHDPDHYRTIAAAKIDQVTFSTNGTIDLIGTDQAAAALAVEFPRRWIARRKKTPFQIVPQLGIEDYGFREPEIHRLRLPNPHQQPGTGGLGKKLPGKSYQRRSSASFVFPVVL